MNTYKISNNIIKMVLDLLYYIDIMDIDNGNPDEYQDDEVFNMLFYLFIYSVIIK